MCICTTLHHSITKTARWPQIHEKNIHKRRSGRLSAQRDGRVSVAIVFNKKLLFNISKLHNASLYLSHRCLQGKEQVLDKERSLLRWESPASS